MKQSTEREIHKTKVNYIPAPNSKDRLGVHSKLFVTLVLISVAVAREKACVIVIVIRGDVTGREG